MGNAIVWLRDDLRLADNPALNAAISHAQATGGRLVILYVLDEVSGGVRPLGGAVKWWLHHSLERLAARIERLDGTLILRRGAAFDELRKLLRETDATGVFWNRRYGGAERDLDAEIKGYASAAGLEAQSFQANLMFEPWTVRTGGGTPYTVFTPFWKSCLNRPEPIRSPLDAPTNLLGLDSSSTPARDALASDNLDAWSLLPTNPDWSLGLSLRWQPGEVAAHEKLEHFIEHRLEGYAAGRDFPADNNTSELSPHLRFGEISPFQIFERIRRVPTSGASDDMLEGIRRFKAEVGWREFSYNLLFHWPDLATNNFDSRFDHFEWSDPNDGRLTAWKHGTTGVPLVDAGMRELWQTGYMHNRVRMVAASFLIKNLLIDWRIGEAWFWDTLVDADPANNAASWQWVAGCGADAAPYFRVFNPILQAEKFDSEKRYRERYLGNYETDIDYPAPIIDLATSRGEALEAFANVSGRSKQVRPPASLA
jgi:deoxyribodipyrimidine photo-lyase